MGPALVGILVTLFERPIPSGGTPVNIFGPDYDHRDPAAGGIGNPCDISKGRISVN